MNIQWEPKIGPASVISLIGGLSMLVSVGIVWGKTSNKLDNLSAKVDSAVGTADKIQGEAKNRDDKLAALSERTAKIENALTFMVPALQRIESKIDGQPIRR